MFEPHATLRTIALEQPATIRVFERLHLDYCCGGNRALTDACAQKGLAVEPVLASLAEAVKTPEPEQDFTQATLNLLMRHIVSTHHAYVREELPRLLLMAERSAAKHGPAHPEIVQIGNWLQQLSSELLLHLMKEESILFPYVGALEEASQQGAEAPHACFATVESPIGAMLNEHEAAGTLLEQMRTATGGFAPPADACPTLVGLMDGLAAFERDLHRHIHLENNLLFPRAIELEKQVLVVG